ncbi:MAG: rod shape-determining protein MreC [Zoogloeaceae bacterium]|jgi:rod shape-determining protein MreC|nr:rod shape-determining protein MreC [Zoogloeaceae bacterium]
MSSSLDEAPPFFRNGPTPFARFCFYVACALILFILDLRFQALDTVRQMLYGIVEPLRTAVQTPVILVGTGKRYVLELQKTQAENQALKIAQLKAAPLLIDHVRLVAENQRLTTLLELQNQAAAPGEIARVLYSARDPFSRRVYLDKGLRQNIQRGSPVVDDKGVIGQITQVYLSSSEVTLITDKDQSLPVQVTRTAQRSFVFGLGNGLIELKYIPINADVRPGDLLTTSGIDGVYPPGYPVARVSEVTHDGDDAFARIVAKPLAEVENQSLVLIIPALALPPRPEETAENPAQPPAAPAAPAPRRAPSH